jgi:hypothetical protein
MRSVESQERMKSGRSLLHPTGNSAQIAVQHHCCLLFVLLSYPVLDESSSSLATLLHSAAVVYPVPVPPHHLENEAKTFNNNARIIT